MANFRAGGFSQMPTVVKNLIIINVLVFFLQQVLGRAGVDVDGLIALHYWQSPLFRWWQLITHMFMHGNLMHIFFNMFALWMFGTVLENMLGPSKFLLFYFICGFGAALCHLTVLTYQFTQFHNAFMHYQQNPTLEGYAQFLKKGNLTDAFLGEVLRFWNDNKLCADCGQQTILRINSIYAGRINEATVGASGAVFGLLFAFGYLLPNAELMLLFPPIPIKAKWFVTGYAAIELFLGIQNSASDNIAHFAHLGGMLFAFILLKVWRTRRSLW